MTLLYFAEDGNYGNAEGMITLASDVLSQEEITYLEEATDFYRNAIAKEILLGKTLDEIKVKYGE